MRDPGNEVVSKVFEQLVGKQITAGCDKQLCVNSSAYRKKIQLRNHPNQLGGGVERGQRCKHNVDRYVESFRLVASTAIVNSLKQTQSLRLPR